MATTSYRLATILSSSGTLTTSGIIGLMPYLQLNGLVWPALLTRADSVSAAEFSGDSGERYRAAEPHLVAAFTPLVEKAEEPSGARH